MKKPSPARKIFGFTLLELLVVISIIGILVAIGAASFSVAQRQGRNAKRRGDMKAVQNAMEQCRAASATQSYVGCCSGTTTITCTNMNGGVSNPGGGTGFNYTATPAAPTQDDYQYCAPLEPAAAGSYCVSELQ